MNIAANDKLAALQNELRSMLADTALDAATRCSEALRIRREISRVLRGEGSPAGLGLTGLQDLRF